jgi:hypothetical protein
MGQPSLLAGSISIRRLLAKQVPDEEVVFLPLAVEPAHAVRTPATISTFSQEQELLPIDKPEMLRGVFLQPE